MKRNTDNNVISFRQPAEFYIRKAEQHIEKGNFLEALQLYRKLIGMDPSNAQYLLFVAQVYSEIGLYNESNDIIHKIMRQGETPTECLFALGCNYLGLGKQDLADGYFLEYMKRDPQGEYAEDIDEIWELYFDEPEEKLSIIKDDSAKKLAQKGKEHLDRCDYRKAIEYYEMAIDKAPQMLHAANNLALCYYFDGKLSAASKTSAMVLEQRPANIHAHCNLALVYYKMHDPRMYTHLEAIESAKITEPQDMHKVALMYCELDYHDRAYKWFVNILSFTPYDIRILHFCGIAAINCGLYTKALECFLRIQMIDPANSVASYYMKIAQIAKNTGSCKMLDYVYQVPFDEIKRRMKYLRDILKESDSLLKDKWQNDDYFVSILLWGLGYGDNYIKRLALEIISAFADERSEEIFRDFILKSTEPDELKNDVFLYLNNMGAKEPYIALIKGEFAEVRIDTASSKINDLANKYLDTLNLFMRRCIKRHEEKTITSGVELFISFASKKGSDAAWIRRPEALAAALELVTCEKLSLKKESKARLATLYSTTAATITRYYNILKETEPYGGENND